MVKNISDVIYNIDSKELDTFLSKTESTLTTNSDIKTVNVDYSWLDVLEETLPYIDTIVRNPRKFLVQEEEVVDIEKVKGINELTIRHLAGHSENIQDIDDKGNVMPSKLLNIYKEDTTDLYENRFIYTLVKRLEEFINIQLENLDIVSKKEINKNISYRATTNINSRKLDIELIMREYNEFEINKDGTNYRDRILACYEIISGFADTEMIKSLNGCTKVSSPIRKTNMILRDPNFKQAYLLWESLDRFIYKEPKIVDYENVTNSDSDLKDEFTLAYFINANAIDDNKDNLIQYRNIKGKLTNLINEYLYEADHDLNKFSNLIDTIYKQAVNEKEAREKNIANIYKNFVGSYKNKINEINNIFE